jgi:hypothetical protein
VKLLELWGYIGCFRIAGLEKCSNFDLPIHSFNRICQTGGGIDINQNRIEIHSATSNRFHPLTVSGKKTSKGPFNIHAKDRIDGSYHPKITNDTSALWENFAV